jgi:hypothetical protein
MRLTLIVFLTIAFSLKAFGQVETPDTSKAAAEQAPAQMLEVLIDTTNQALLMKNDSLKLADTSHIPLRGIDVRWGWSLLSDDGSFFLNPLLLDNWQNVTLRPLPASFSVHFPFRENKTGSSSQVGIQSFYSASEAPIIAGLGNSGTAHYFSVNADFRTNFRKISWLGDIFSPHINYGLGYTYRSVALHNHEPIVHLGLGGTFWLTERWGITAAGTGHIGMLHWLYGHASYLQANLYGVYRF